MEHWDIRSLAIEPHRTQVLRSDDETRAIAIRLPSGEELQEHQVHERTYLLVVDSEIEIAQDGSSVTGGIGLLSPFEPNERRDGARAQRRAARARARPVAGGAPLAGRARPRSGLPGRRVGPWPRGRPTADCCARTA